MEDSSRNLSAVKNEIIRVTLPVLLRFPEIKNKLGNRFDDCLGADGQ